MNFKSDFIIRFLKLDEVLVQLYLCIILQHLHPIWIFLLLPSGKERAERREHREWHCSRNSVHFHSPKYSKFRLTNFSKGWHTDGGGGGHWIPRATLPLWGPIWSSQILLTLISVPEPVPTPMSHNLHVYRWVKYGCKIGSEGMGLSFLSPIGFHGGPRELTRAQPTEKL